MRVILSTTRTITEEVEYTVEMTEEQLAELQKGLSEGATIDINEMEYDIIDEFISITTNIEEVVIKADKSITTKE